ncbi:MAG: hypothetical protein N2Z22_05270 [Turneriella sp.]|nr:hypothetical protein [Turneriella sp.]
MQQIKNFWQKHPLASALLLAFVIRTIAALRNYGPFAHDDFINIIDPALQYLFTGQMPPNDPLRFAALPYAFAALMQPLYALGVRRADFLVSFGYFVLACISLLQIVAIYRIGDLLFSERTRNALALFTASWAVVPLFSHSTDLATPSYLLMSFAIFYLIKAFPENFGLPIQQNRWWPAAVAGFFVSAAVLFRFSLAPVYFALALWILLCAKQKIKSLTFFALGGLATTLLMVGIELLGGQRPFSTAIEFIRYNFAMHVKTQSYGTMPWYTYLGLSLLFPLPGIGLIFWPYMLRLMGQRRFRALTVIYIAFLVSHSLVAFKLDRYFIPMLPVLSVFLFAVMEYYGDKAPVRHGFRAFWLVNGLLILPLALTMQQRAGVDGAIFAGSVDAPLFVSKIEPWRPGYYGYHKVPPHFAEKEIDIVRTAQEKNYQRFYVYRFLYYTEQEFQEFQKQGFSCQLERTFRPDLAERIAIWLNPEMNRRRDDTTLYLCKAVGKNH